MAFCNANRTSAVFLGPVELLEVTIKSQTSENVCFQNKPNLIQVLNRFNTSVLSDRLVWLARFHSLFDVKSTGTTEDDNIQ